MPSMSMRRKKWTEEEEETLISKYAELFQSGFLSKMKTRERKFEPIAAHVNSLFHSQNPVSYPWQWTWKDASTKVQNMRHQYLGVKQKIRRIVGSIEEGEHEDYDWEEGLSLWSNFLKYKEVFGDQELDMNGFLTQGNPRALPGRSRPRPPLSENGGLLSEAAKAVGMEGFGRVGLDGETGVLDLCVGFEYEGEGEENGIKDGAEDYEDDDDEVMDLTRRRKRRQWRRSEMGLGNSIGESRILSFIASQFAELREREARREEREKEREREREKRELLRAEAEMERERQREQWERERWEQEQLRQREAERMEREREEQELKRELLDQQRREAERKRSRAREEKMELEKMEWREKIETRNLQHQATMMEIQSQIAQSQQNTVAMLLGVLLQLTSEGNDFSGQGSSLSPFVSQLLQNLQPPANDIVQCGIRRGGGESSDSQFDVDG